MANISAISTKITANADNFNTVVNGVEGRLRKLQESAQKKSGMTDSKTADIGMPLNFLKNYEDQYGRVGRAARFATGPVTSFVEGLLRLKQGAIWQGIAYGINQIKKLGDTEQLKSASRGILSIFSFKNLGSAVAGGFNLIGMAAKAALLPIIGLIAGLTTIVVLAISQGMAFRRAAIEVGESTDEYTRYATALKIIGVSAEDAKASLLELANSANDAKMGDKVKADTFKQLNVSLNNSPVKTFKDIAESMQGIKSSTEKAYIAHKLFGAQAANVLPLLGMQKKQLDDILGTADRMGTIMGDKEGMQLEATNMKFREMKEMLIGIGQKILTALMPIFIGLFRVMEKVTGNGTGLAKVFKTLGNIAVTVFYLMNEAFVLISKAFAYIKIAMNSIAIGFLRVVRGIVEGVKYVGDAMGDLNPFGTMTETLDSLTTSIEYYREARDDQHKYIEELNKSRFSLADTKKMISDAADEMESYAKKVHQADGAIRDLATKKKMFEDAMKIEHDVLTPMDEFQSKIQSLDTLLNNSVLKWETYARAVGMAVNKLEEATHASSIALPNAARMGSAESASAVTRARAEFELKNAETPQKRIERLSQQQVTIQQQIAVYSAETARALRDRQPVKIGN